MDKLVKRVTVVQGGKGHRHSTVVYEHDDDTEEHDLHPLRPLEKAVRYMLKADLIMAQEAYDRHVKSASRGGDDWVLDAPSNILKAQEKGLKEVRKINSIAYDDEDEGE